MLLEYSVSNFRSFFDHIYLDLHPPASKVKNRYPGNFVQLPSGEKVLKDAVIVGENAGGKTNFVDSLSYLRQLITRTDRPPRSLPKYVNSKNLVTVERDEGKNRRIGYDSKASMSKQEFSITIALEDATYCYELTIDAKRLLFESLVYQKGKGKKEIPVFSFVAKDPQKCVSCEEKDDCEKREDGVDGFIKYVLDYMDPDSDFDDKLIEALNDSERPFPSIALVRLATLGEKRCKDVLNWLMDDLIISRSTESDFLQALEESGELKSVLESSEYLEILQLIDQSICGFRCDREKPFEDSYILRRDNEGKIFYRVVKDDSAGVGQYLYWAFYVYEVVHNNKTVIADEIDSAINPIMSDKILAFINGTYHTGQFIFTTHNIFNLTLRTFMKEQIYFVTKDQKTLTSSFYSLADFDEIRYDVKEELYEFYMRGVLGGTVDV